MTFTHLDADQRPTMVDVSEKAATKRSATAEARVRFPTEVAAALRANGLRSAKGPVFDTAIVAGVLGAVGVIAGIVAHSVTSRANAQQVVGAVTTGLQAASQSLGTISSNLPISAAGK